MTDSEYSAFCKWLMTQDGGKKGEKHAAQLSVVLKSIYIKENTTPLSRRRLLIGWSPDFTREHSSSRE